MASGQRLALTSMILPSRRSFGPRTVPDLLYPERRYAIPRGDSAQRRRAAHYVLGGPQCEKNNPFSLAAPTSEYYVMHGETAAAAMYVRQLVKASKAGQPLDDIIENMNELINAYHVKSRPKFAAKLGMVDEIVPMDDLRNYMMAFTQAAYQNPSTICPPHQMLTPRCIREYNKTKK